MILHVQNYDLIIQSAPCFPIRTETGYAFMCEHERIVCAKGTRKKTSVRHLTRDGDGHRVSMFAITRAVSGWSSHSCLFPVMRIGSIGI